jgi:hypothetical protein
VKKSSKVVSKEERPRVDPSFLYLIQKVQQLFKQLLVVRFVKEIPFTGCKAKKSDV